MIQIIKALHTGRAVDTVTLNRAYNNVERLVAWRTFPVSTAPEHQVKLFEFKTVDDRGQEHITRINAYPGRMSAEFVKGKGSVEPAWTVYDQADALMLFHSPSIGEPFSENAAIVMIAHVLDRRGQLTLAFEVVVREKPGENWATVRVLPDRNALEQAVNAWSWKDED